MRQRTIQEGSIGLLILVGIGIFSGLVLWLRGVTFGKKTYSMIVEFENVEGMQIGANVRYRGFDVGGISAIRPGSNGVEVTISIHQPSLLIPKNVRIEANQSGLVGSTSIDIIPLSPVPDQVQGTPLSSDCDQSILICNGDRLPGVIGVSYVELLRQGLKMAELFASDEFYAQLILTLQEATAAAEKFSTLSTDLSALTGEFSELTQLAKGEIGTISQTTQSIGAAADQVRQSTLAATGQFTESAAKLTAEVETTNRELQKALQNVNELVVQNRSTLTNTLVNLEQTSEQMRIALGTLTPILSQVQQGELLSNLETLSANAAQASANLRDVSHEINNPNTLLMLQQTLDSARSTFQNAQKLTSDLDELIGDPEFRQNIRNLVNGLGELVSSTEHLHQQTAIAQILGPTQSQLSESLAQSTHGFLSFSPLANEISLDSTPLFKTEAFPSPAIDFNSNR